MRSPGYTPLRVSERRADDALSAYSAVPRLALLPLNNNNRFAAINVVKEPIGSLARSS